MKDNKWKGEDNIDKGRREENRGRKEYRRRDGDLWRKKRDKEGDNKNYIKWGEVKILWWKDKSERK